MEKISFISGIALIALSGILFTVERFIAIFYYAAESFPVKLNGSGSYPSEPNMASGFENIFVWLLFILGVALFIYGAKSLFVDTKKSEEPLNQ